MTREEAIEQGRREGIHPDDAGSIFDKLEALTLMVKAGEITHGEMMERCRNHARTLANERKLRTIMSPNLDVLTGRLK